MINNIPTSEEFTSAGKAHLDFSWDIVMSFLTLIHEFEQYVNHCDEDVKDINESAQHRVLSALAIAQQGVEFVLKGMIAEISPYLLISGAPSEWPKSQGGVPLDFSDFRTIDAQDLITVLNNFSSNELDPKLIENFDRLRKLRNGIMHSVNVGLEVSAVEVMITILEMHKLLRPDENWVKIRREFLSNSPESLIGLSDGIEGQLAHEFNVVFHQLEPNQMERFFGVSKRQRTYICPVCQEECEKNNTIQPDHAVFRPKEPGSVNLYCFVCDTIHLVRRVDCENPDCQGNAISEETGNCCTCGEDYS